MNGRFPEPGKVFEGKYRVKRLLGSGGFARVYLAEQIGLSRDVAIKVLSPKIAVAVSAEQTDPEIEAVALRFEREAKIVSQLKSPQTITMYDYGRTLSGLLYMVMEYVDGSELDAIDIPVEPRRVVAILEQILKSLHEAHLHGLLHRDLKPANIMVYEHLGEGDRIKLLDFGIAKVVGQAANENSRDLTSNDSLVGTPRYMSPEQIRGAEIGPPSDLYSVGLIGYELLMGEKAISTSDSIEILGRHLSVESFEIPRNLAVHGKLRRILNKLLEKNVDARYGTTQEVLDELKSLDQLGGDLRSGGPPPMPGDLEKPPSVDDTDVYDLSDVDIEFSDRSSGDARRRVVAAGIALIALIGVVIAWQTWGPEESPAPPMVTTVDGAADTSAGPAEPTASPATRVRTRPAGAKVWFDGKLAGEAPIDMDSADREFPVTIRAKLGGHSVEHVLDAPGGTVELDLSSASRVTDNGPPADAGNADTAVDAVPGDSGPDASQPTQPPESASSDHHPRTHAPRRSHPRPAHDEPKDDEDDEDVDTRRYLPLE